MGWSCCSNRPATTWEKNLIAKRGSRRKRGRIELRWEDKMSNDDKALGERNWKNITRHRHMWQNVLGKSVAQVELFCE
jgi:hypothetical protein